MSGSTGEVVQTLSSGPATASPEHLTGFSSLVLLAGSAHARVLYLLTWQAATIATARAAEMTSSTIAVDGWQRLPLADHSVDAVVADFDAVPDVERIHTAVAAEIGRVLRRDGRFVAAVTHRRRPRNRRDWMGYRLVAPLSRWPDPLRRAGFVQIDLARLAFDGPRITTIDLAPEPARDEVPKRTADAVALVLSRSRSAEPSLVAEISNAVRELGANAGIERIHVRKIGKAAAFVARGTQRLVVRMPCSAVATARARRNHAALLALHDPQSGADIPKDLVPVPLAQGNIEGRPYFVESVVPGTPREGRVDRIRWEPQALELITALHASTAQSRVLSDLWFGQAIEPAIVNVETCVDDPEHRRTLAWLRSALRRRFVGQRLPLVRSHGDFTGSNCLYDDRGRLAGVVDWELSSPDALPLLDLLQLFDLPAEYTPDGRWERAELVADAVIGTGPLFRSPAILTYMHALVLKEDLLAGLLLAWWLDHVGARIAARRPDARWFARRVQAPLARLGALTRDVTSRSNSPD